MRLYGALISLSLIWGMSFLFIKILDSHIGPSNIVFLRCLFGALPLYILIVWKTQKETWRGVPWGKIGIVGLMNAAIPWTLIALSETVIKSSTASTLNATTPIWASLIGFCFFSVRLSIRQWVGILIGFIGILILLGFDISDFLGDNFIGTGTMIVATLCYGFSSQFIKRFLGGVSVLVVAGGTLTVGMVVNGCLSIILNGFPTEAFQSWESIVSLIGLGVFGSGIAYVLSYYMIKEGSAEFSTFATYLAPVTAVLWGWLLLDEPLSTHLIIGLLIIFGGVYLSGKQAKRKTTHALKM